MAWNDYLQGNADRAVDLRAFVRKGAALTADLDKLLDAGSIAVRTRDAHRFVALRDRMLRHTPDIAKSLESDFERFSAVSSADRKLVTTLNSSGEARAVAAAVNEKYPTGYLASIMGRDTR